jgi:selenide,water dikinase
LNGYYHGTVSRKEAGVLERKIKLTNLAKCGGCAAKVGAAALRRFLENIETVHDPNFLVGFDKSDDASVYKLNDDLALVQTIDFFPPVVNDPFIFGQVAATNALSDVYAMGGVPKLALNLLCVPEGMPSEIVHEILRGGYDKAYEAGVIITGGHSIYDDEPKYGMAVTGFVHPDRLLTNSGAKPGDVLLLTKPLGVGILITAQKGGCLSTDDEGEMLRLMTTLNKSACECMLQHEIHACTDITGFGLLGHLHEMTEGAGVSAVLDTAAIDIIPSALAYARDKILPSGVYRNRSFVECYVDAGEVSLPVQDCLYDPQTAGGLLIAVNPDQASDLLAQLEKCVLSAQHIGEITSPQSKAILLR